MAAEELKLADIPPSEGAPSEGHTPPPAEGEAPADHSTEGLSEGTEHAGGDAHGAKPGLPQLDITTFASQLFWLVISFVILYVVISRIAAPKIGGVIQDRANRIKGDLDAAAQAKSQSEAAVANYDKALADARAKALKASDELRNAVQAEINAKNDAAARQLATETAMAEARIGEMRKAAMARVGEVARETAADIVAKLTGEAANAGDVEAAVAAALKRA
jgi:F-type H+-transporting ATPase subunit b